MRPSQSREAALAAPADAVPSSIVPRKVRRAPSSEAQGLRSGVTQPAGTKTTGRSADANAVSPQNAATVPAGAILVKAREPRDDVYKA
jgi:hypothetical protein